MGLFSDDDDDYEFTVSARGTEIMETVMIIKPRDCLCCLPKVYLMTNISLRGKERTEIILASRPCHIQKFSRRTEIQNSQDVL